MAELGGGRMCMHPEGIDHFEGGDICLSEFL